MQPGRVLQVLGETALQALLGGVGVMIAIGLTRWLLLGLLGDMLPAVPVDLAQEEGARLGSWLQAIVAGYDESPYRYAYLVSFVGLAFYNLTTAGRELSEGSFAARLEERWRWAAQNWFSLLIGNAWGAFIGAIVILFLAQFSLIRILIEAVLTALQPLLYSVAELVASGDQVATAELAVAWYGEHELRLLFWSLYLSNVLDDLGAPNLKSLWHRARARFGRGGRASKSEPEGD